MGRLIGLEHSSRAVNGLRVPWWKADTFLLAHRAAVAIAQGLAPGALFASAIRMTEGLHTEEGPFVLLAARLDLPRARLVRVVFTKLPEGHLGLLGELVANAISTSEPAPSRVRAHDQA
jgi:hypothetical protein